MSVLQDTTSTACPIEEFKIKLIHGSQVHLPLSNDSDSDKDLSRSSINESIGIM